MRASDGITKNLSALDRSRFCTLALSSPSSALSAYTNILWTAFPKP